MAGEAVASACARETKNVAANATIVKVEIEYVPNTDRLPALMPVRSIICLVPLPTAGGSCFSRGLVLLQCIVKSLVAEQIIARAQHHIRHCFVIVVSFVRATEPLRVSPDQACPQFLSGTVRGVD